MRSRTANELEQRAKILLTAIQREYDDHMIKKISEPQQSSTNDKENENENENTVEKNRDKKTKRKSWMPAISFVESPNRGAPKAKKTDSSSSSSSSSSNDVALSHNSMSNPIASTSGWSNKPVEFDQKSLDMPLLD